MRVETKTGSHAIAANIVAGVSLLQPLLRIRNSQRLHNKGNSQNVGFLLLWSTIKGARLDLEDALGSAMLATTHAQGCYTFFREVQSMMPKMSYPRWDVRGANAQRMKRLRDENAPHAHKRCTTEELDVPIDLQDMEIPLQDMGDVIVFTGL